MGYKLNKYYLQGISLKVMLLYFIGFAYPSIVISEDKTQSIDKILQWTHIKEEAPEKKSNKINKPNLKKENKIINQKQEEKKFITLDDIDSLVKEKNKELQIMAIRIDEARYLLRSEISAWYPNFNISSSGLPQYLSGNTSNKLSTNTSNSQTKAGIKATIQWDLINPSRLPQIAKAKSNFENARIAYTIKSRDLILAAKSEFFNIQNSIQDIRIAKESIKTSQVSLEDSNIRFKNGLSSKFDVLEAETQLSKDKQFLAEKQGKYMVYKSNLSQYL